MMQLTRRIGSSTAAPHGQLFPQHHNNVLPAQMHGDYKPPMVQKFCVTGLQTEMSVLVIVDFHFLLSLLMSANRSLAQTFFLIFTW
ncbi:MAG: hypothetical protein VX367_05320, partial [SAR324 cluster bacterium]|nr:hypothetical protein [SAR324 cluster bacterium]